MILKVSRSSYSFPWTEWVGNEQNPDDGQYYLISLHNPKPAKIDSPQQIPCILVNFSDRKYQHRIAVGNGVQLLTIQDSESERYRNEV